MGDGYGRQALDGRYGVGTSMAQRWGTLRKGRSGHLGHHSLRLILAFSLVTGLATAFTLTTSSASAGAAASDWTVYHHDVGGSGVDTSGALPSTATPAWTSATS